MRAVMMLSLVALALGQTSSYYVLQDGTKCPPEGTGKSAKSKKINALKNREEMPTSVDIDDGVSLAALLAPGDDEQRFDSARAGRITGYVIDVFAAGRGESCNCGAKKHIDMDTHIEVGAAPGVPENQRVIVEVSPRLRKKMAESGDDWSSAGLKQALMGKWVTITGWLLFDYHHADEAENTHPGNATNWRATAWELHPVTSLTVLSSPPTPAPILSPATLNALRLAHRRDTRDDANLNRRLKSFWEGFTEDERQEALRERAERRQRGDVEMPSGVAQMPHGRDTVKGALAQLENRMHNAPVRSHSAANIEKARKAAELIGGTDPAAFCRAFDAVLLGTQPGEPSPQPNRFLRVPSLLRNTMFGPAALDGHATASIFDEPRYLANARELILSRHVDRYPGSMPNRIVGGFVDDADEFPDCVAVGSDEDGYCCTGTLIAPDLVLTAGHCYECCNEQRGGKVHIGRKAYGPGQTIKVLKAIRHPEYGLNGRHNDIALLVLAQNAAIRPRPLASAAEVQQATFICAVGYGNTNFGGSVGYGTRRLATIPIAALPGQTTTRKYGHDEGWEFVGGGIGLDVDTCTGDSGGPALVNGGDGGWCLAGVTSRMTREAARTCGDGGIYALVPKYSDWYAAARNAKTDPRPEAHSAVRKSARADAGRHVVYVHGICAHTQGYSDPWWQSLRSHLQPTVPEGNRHEVLWSDLVNAERRVRALKSGEHAETKKRIMEQLRDRTVRQRVDAAGDERGLDTERRLLDDIPFVGCIDDFTIYLLDDDVRAAIKRRCADEVVKLLRSGARVELVSHSWGTVVAYEALRDLEASGESFRGTVQAFFTVGSALSIAEVKSRLQANAIDGAKPSFVRTWANLNARFDIVGGNLKGAPFAVDEEHLGLRPSGCSTFIPNPVCSHGSYFDRDNITVNRDIFARLINE